MQRDADGEFGDGGGGTALARDNFLKLSPRSAAITAPPLDTPMPERSRLPSLLTALALTLASWATAQTSPPALTAAERAQREADRVFSVIKFHTIRSKPATEAASKPVRPPVQRPAQPARPAAAVAAAAPAAEAPPGGDESKSESSSLTAAAAAMLPIALPAAAAPEEPAGATPSTPEAEAEAETDEPEETPLRMQSFVAPVLTPAVQATLNAGGRHVRVRLTVEADGTVSQAEAAANVPRRLAKPATDAILQWRFAPLAQARTTEVEIAFRRD